MAWTITYSGSSVVLPEEPEKATLKYGSNIKEISVPGQNMLLVFGDKADVLTWTGKLTGAGKSNSDLMTDYIKVLKDFMHQEVTISGTSMYDDTWVLNSVVSDIKKSTYGLIDYKIEFIDSDSVIIVG